MHFVESTYGAFRRLEGPLQLHRVASAYIDGIKGGFLETQALALGVLGEYLVGTWLKRHDPDYRVVPKSIGRPLHRALLTTARQFLAGREAALDNVHSARQALDANLPRVCDPTLRQKLKHVNEQLGAGIESTAISRFVDTRNDLAHRMEFDPTKGTERVQYQNMRYVVDRLLLALLGYEGPFVDFRTRERRQFTATPSQGEVAT